MKYSRKVSMVKKTQKVKKKKEDLSKLIWGYTQDLTRKQQENVKAIVERYQANPDASFNERKELVYKGDVIGGTNIINLIRQKARGPNKNRILMPGTVTFKRILEEGPKEFELPNKTYVHTRKGGYKEYIWD